MKLSDRLRVAWAGLQGRPIAPTNVVLVMARKPGNGAVVIDTQMTPYDEGRRAASWEANDIALSLMTPEQQQELSRLLEARLSVLEEELA